MQVVESGGSAHDAALLLVDIHRRETAQREQMEARFAKRVKTSATADFDLPAAGEQSEVRMTDWQRSANPWRQGHLLDNDAITSLEICFGRTD